MASYSLSKSWKVLGPFSIGTREQDFGADPLENYGGFHSLKFQVGAKYPSELAEGGFVTWTNTNAVDNTVGPIDFPNVRWKDNGVPFGWSIEQYQAWARGTLTVTEATKLFIQVNGMSEFYIDGKRYSGDAYDYRKITHLVYLERGVHIIDVRMVHDIRVFGGGKTPQCKFHIHIDAKTDTLVYPEDCAVIIPSNMGEIVLPDYLNDIGFAGSFGSVSIQNAGDDPIVVKSITLCIVDEHTLSSRTKSGLFIEYNTQLILEDQELIIIPGQTRPVGFQFQKNWGTVPSATILKTWVRIGLSVKEDGSSSYENEFAIRATSSVRCVDWMKSSFRYTFKDYDDTVQYAVVKRPRILNRDANKPIIVALHGAGVEADSAFWITSIPAQKYAWVIFPTGRTPWGYDWHGPSALNVFSAISGLEKLQELLPPHFECIDSTGGDWVNVSTPHETLRTLKPEDDREWNIGDPQRRLYMGHSNGGQGTWYMTSHYPDTAVAAIPAAGYIKIQDYVSYANWTSISYSDPLLRGILECAIAEYNNDLYLSNMCHLPLLPRIGTEDDNVPPLHTRKYVRILNGLVKNESAIRISEVPYKGHWWSTVFDDKVVQDFLNKYTSTSKKDIQDPPTEFCISTMNPASIGSVHGIQIEQLLKPYRLAKIQGSDITQNGKKTLKLATTNVSAFRLAKSFKPRDTLILDNDVFSHLERKTSSKDSVFFLFDKVNKKWKMDHTWQRSLERSRMTYGPIHRMYESSGPLIIVIPSDDLYEYAALQISHDWYMYGGGDAMIITDDVKRKEDGVYYKLYLGLPHENKQLDQLLSEKPCGVTFERNSKNKAVSIKVGNTSYKNPGTGILYMQPGLYESEMAIVISGLDQTGFSSAWRLLPKRTGAVIPEWIVTSPEMKSVGVGGVLGAGYFDNEWKPFGYT